MTARDRIRAAISDSYYDARNDGLTMEHAADTATAKVMHIFEEREQQWRESTRALVDTHNEEMADGVLIMVERTDG